MTKDIIKVDDTINVLLNFLDYNKDVSDSISEHNGGFMSMKPIKIVYGTHWFDHIVMAIKIIANKHPDNYVRIYWNDVNEAIMNKKCIKND